MASSEGVHAVILAAGLGERLLPLTQRIPKPLLPLGGKPILCHALESISRLGITTATIVVGYLKDEIKRTLGQTYAGVRIDYVDADAYESTNNIYSLWLARHRLDRNVLLLEGDVIFEDEVLKRLLEAGSESMAVAPYETRLSGSLVHASDDGVVEDFVLKAEQGRDFDFGGAFKTVNLYFLGKKFLERHFVPQLCHAIETGDVGTFYERILKDVVASDKVQLRAVNVGDCAWCEVDDHDDLARAAEIFSEPSQRYQRVSKLFGGHWRYDFADHNHLYNLHFPPQELLDSLRDDLPSILSHYPPGQAEMARLVGDWTGADPRQIVVANGSSELIRIICGQMTAGMVTPEPSFNEYENSVDPSRFHSFPLDPNTFELDVDAFAHEVVRTKADLAVVVTPNNPTSLSVPREDLLKLLTRLSRHDCMVLVDESFIEFSHGGWPTSLESVMDRYPNLVVLKSMSKVFGIAGLRLGYLATSNANFSAEVRRRLPIWNINGFSEAALRALVRYREAFNASIDKVRDDYRHLYNKLKCIPSLHIYEPDANFVFCRIESDSVDGPSLAEQLFTEYKILIKDCSNKAMPNADRYLRIGSRTVAENERLVGALKELLAGREIGAPENDQ